MSASLILFIYALAVMRVTRLINFDTIMDWLHIWVGGKFGPGSWQAEFIRCPWCVGMWVALLSAWVPLLFLCFPQWWLYAAVYLLVALAASMITGLFAPLSSEDDELVP